MNHFSLCWMRRQNENNVLNILCMQLNSRMLNNTLAPFSIRFFSFSFFLRAHIWTKNSFENNNKMRDLLISYADESFWLLLFLSFSRHLSFFHSRWAWTQLKIRMLCLFCGSRRKTKFNCKISASTRIAHKHTFGSRGALPSARSHKTLNFELETGTWDLLPPEITTCRNNITN